MKAATGEDKKRAHRMRRVLNRPGRTNWLNIGDRMWLVQQCLPHVRSPDLDREAISDLAGRLEAGVVSGTAPPTLASSLRMREIRAGLIQALLDAFVDYPNETLRTATVIYSGWRFTPVELESQTANKLKRQFRRHLERAGVLEMPGPLFAVLHGEFESTAGLYILHFHCLTTEAKAAALKAGLTAKNIQGYQKTLTGAVPVRCPRVRNRVGQFSYLAKAFWPYRPVLWIKGRWKRVRHPRRIPEPYHTQVLLWLDRQRFADLVLTHDCWSKRRGGTAAMWRLCLFVDGVSRSMGSAG